jgi:phosphoribosylglycinamide formyltransferase-1
MSEHLTLPDSDSPAPRRICVPTDRRPRVGVLVSGGGTTLVNFVRERAAGRLPLEFPLVIASRADCGGIARAAEAGIPCEVVPRKSFSGVSAFSAAVFAKLRAVRVDLVALAGFLSLLEIPDDFRDRVLNIHPSLIPAFCGHGFHGHHVHEAVIARGACVSGCTVHLADNEYDHGPIVLQRVVPVLERDTPDTLARRVFAAECEAFPEALRRIATGRMAVVGPRVVEW